MFPFLFGFSIMHFIENIMKNAMTQNFNIDTKSPFSLKYSTYMPSERILQIIAQNEEGGNGLVPKSKTYIDAVGAPTIGFGTHTIVKRDGKDFNPAHPKVGWTLRHLAALMKEDYKSDFQFARQLMKNYINCFKVANALKKLDEAGIPFYAPLADAIVDSCYNSGGFWRSQSFVSMISELKKRVPINFNSINGFVIAQIFLKWRFNYLISIKIPRSWSNYRRGYIMADRIIGIDRDLSNISRNWQKEKFNYYGY